MAIGVGDIERRMQLMDINYIQNKYINKPAYRLFNEPYGTKLSKEGIEYLQIFHPEIFQIKRLKDLIAYIWELEVGFHPIDENGKHWYFELDDVFEWLKNIFNKYPI